MKREMENTKENTGNEIEAMKEWKKLIQTLKIMISY